MLSINSRFTLPTLFEYEILHIFLAFKIMNQQVSKLCFYLSLFYTKLLEIEKLFEYINDRGKYFYFNKCFNAPIRPNE